MGAAMTNSIFSKIIGPFPQVKIQNSLEKLNEEFQIFLIFNFFTGNLDGDFGGGGVFCPRSVSDLRDGHLFDTRTDGHFRFHDRNDVIGADPLVNILPPSNTLPLRRCTRADSLFNHLNRNSLKK